MFLRTVELAFARFQTRRDPRALAIVFDRTASELLRVARHLGSSAADAEDLVQSTFLQAIESAKGHERGKPVLPWLLGILANQARSARRRDRRAVDPGRLRSDVVVDVVAEAVNHELGAELHAAIGRLPEVYRPVLRMWLDHGLEAQEIARTLERPAGTVRAQISRGLDLLRKALPHGIASGAAVAVVAGRSMAAVRAAVLGACKGTSTGIVSALALGGLLMLHHKLLAVGTALVLGLLGWTWLAGAPPDAPVVAATGGGRTAVAVAAGEAATVGESQVAERREVAVAEPAAPPPPAAAVDPDTGELVVELVSAADAAPLAGIGVAVQRSDDMGSFSRHSRWLPTDANGVVRFTGLRPATWHIDLDRMGAIAAGDVVAGASVHRRVLVPAGLRVAGTVVDEADRPVAGAQIAVHGSRFAAPIVATSDAQGRFVVAHMLAKLHVQAQKPGYEASLVQLLEGNPGAGIEVTLRLRTGGRHVAGRVVDSDGRALARAVVALIEDSAVHVDFWDTAAEQRRPLYLTTDATGAFATDEVGQQRMLVLAMPEGVGEAPGWEFIAAGVEPAFVELRAPRAAVLTGRILGALDPTKVVLQSIALDAAPLGFLANLAAVRVATASADGTYRLEGLPAGRTEIVARRQFETVASTAMTLAAGGELRWDIDLAAAAATARLRVRVRAATPLPAGTVVMVGPHVPDNSAPSIVPLDAGGTAHCSRPVTGGVDVFVCLFPGNRLILQLARRQDVQPAVTEVDFDLDAAQLPSRRITGRLVDARGAPIADTPVMLSRVDASELQARDVPTTDADGRFTTILLPAGTYWISWGGPYAAEHRLGTTVLTVARDEDVGSLTAERR